MITFLKLGGSVITEKSGRMEARLSTIRRLAGEIAQAVRTAPDLQLLLGHGSGSFGHSAAAQYAQPDSGGTRLDIAGFSEVWFAARQLNQIVIEALRDEQLPAVSFPPSASALSKAGELVQIAADPIRHALESGLLPVVYGDVISDIDFGASIASTEKVFASLADELNPQRVLLAGRQAGVFENLEEESPPLPEITPEMLPELQFQDSDGDDVTGGMAAKVELCFQMARQHPGLEMLIFSVEEPGTLRNVLMGESAGTRIRV